MRHTLATILLATTAATPAFAQDATNDDIVIVGTRAQGRLAEGSPSPVDVFDSADLQARGLTDLNRTLQYLAPSFNYPRTATGPSGANTRAATLRGLAPDQVLVLVNGKRWHLSSVLNFNNVVGRGSVPAGPWRDPGICDQTGRNPARRRGGAIWIRRHRRGDQHRPEVLGRRRLRQRTIGHHRTGRRPYADRGPQSRLAIGQGGAINLTAELRDRGATNRAGIDSRFGRITSEQGDPKSLDLNLAGSLRLPVGGVELYAHGIYDHRRSTSPAQFRAPTVAPAFYPQGFVPHIRVDLDDAGGCIGISGDLNGWRFDLSDTVGLSDASFHVSDTVNTSLGTASPRDFAGGGARYFQNVVNLDVSRKFDFAAGLNLAAGAEHRYESFKLRSGEPGSLYRCRRARVSRL